MARVRDMKPEDLPAVVAIEAASFRSPWTYGMLREELDQESGWRSVAEDATGRVVGFLLGRCYPDAWHVVDLAVAPDRRRRGVGGALLDDFLRAADECGVEVVLEVRPGNAEAVSLYGPRGFAVVGIRPKYYPDTDEDAFVMVRPLRTAGEREDGAGGLTGPLLAIESSCDDSAAAVLSPEGRVLSAVTHSQDAIHERYGGVVPEVASRAHVERMTAVVAETLREGGCPLDDLGGVAVTVGPGLIGALLIGVQTAKAIAWSRRLPFFPVNHIHGHLAAAWLADPGAEFPMVTLVASGGHTVLIRVDGRTTFRLLGQTLDDAAGEAFDKGARLLGLGYPGGRELDELAEKGDPESFSFPIGLRRSSRPDFSFSGVKTALYYLLRRMTPDERAARAADLAASYRKAIVEALVGKAVRTAQCEKVRTLAAAGGVAANSLLRRRLTEAGSLAGLHVVIPPPALCTDNAAMIGAAALAGPRLDYPHYLAVDASASLALGRWMSTGPDEMPPPVDERRFSR
ncbi:MAG: tRNA (adenosine(37)-N6)-threonylcarbamoyltransferase complex transferase subunit TsaD [Actinomycetia bacterium]|nr:tRNA (adenosine(37)-N6)-threonylcarbamoyltransferase complex transferase subunit TsaD [Actinomycetes bacterium]